MRRFVTPLALALTLAAGSATAQTTYAFGAVLSGRQEVPPVTTPALGVVVVVYVDSPAPFPDAITVRGGFDDLTGTYAASHLHRAPAGQTGPIVQGLTATTTADQRGGEWQTAGNTFLPTPITLAQLQAGEIYVNVHSSTYPDGELRGQLRPVPLPDGQFNASDGGLYRTLATKQNANAGFGPNIDVTEIVYYPDLFNEVLFLGVKGKLNTASSDGIGVWMGFPELAGRPAGTALCDVAGAGHFMGATANPNCRADFEVDYALALDPRGSPAQNVALHVVDYVGTVSADTLGVTDLAGTAVIGPPNDTDNAGGPATFDAVAFAFNNAGTGQSGLEVAIPFADLGLTASSFAGGAGMAVSDLTVFAFVVSNTAYFSNVTVPGNATGTADGGGNLGFNPNFDTLPGGPYFATVAIAVASEPDVSGRGATLSLGAAAPNPTGGRARLVLTVDRPQAVRAALYDALGREVRTLYAGAAAAGEARTLEVDAAGLPAGVYVVRVAGETFTASQRLTVAR